MERREGNGFLTEGEVYRISNGLRCGDTDFIYLFGCAGSSSLGKLSLDAASRATLWLQCAGFSLQQLLLLGSRGSRHGLQ